MWFEQVMATHKSRTATPDGIEEAILKEVGRKSSKGTDYGVDDMALIVFADYNGKLSDLRALSIAIQDATYKAIYLVAKISENAKDCVCVILKSPGDKLGPISVSFNRSDGKADVSRMLEN